MTLAYRICEIICAQYLTKDVSDFNVATFSLAVSVFRPLALFIKQYKKNYSKAKEDAGAEHDIFVEKPSLWLHTLINHSGDQLYEHPVSLQAMTELVIDNFWGKLKKASSCASGHKRDIVNILEKVYDRNEIQLATMRDPAISAQKDGDHLYDKLPERLNMVVAPCFADIHDDAMDLLNGIKGELQNRGRDTHVRSHPTIKDAWFLSKSKQDDISKAIEIYSKDSKKWLVLKTCEDGTCNRCKGAEQREVTSYEHKISIKPV